MAETRGTRALRRDGVPFRLHVYRHDRKGAAFAADALGIALERFAKTLVVEVDGEPALVLVPGHRELSTRRLARAAGARTAALAAERDAERLTGYLVGGIGPFGTRRPLPVWVETSLTAFDAIAVNAGQRGVIVEVDPAALVRALGARVADVAASEGAGARPGGRR